MNETQKRIVVLLKEKKRIEKEIEKLKNQLVKQYCPKKKKECEPAYCTFRITDTCPFLTKWRRILDIGVFAGNAFDSKEKVSLKNGAEISLPS